MKQWDDQFQIARNFSGPFYEWKRFVEEYPQVEGDAAHWQERLKQALGLTLPAR